MSRPHPHKTTANHKKDPIKNIYQHIKDTISDISSRSKTDLDKVSLELQDLVDKSKDQENKSRVYKHTIGSIKKTLNTNFNLNFLRKE